MNGDPRFLTVAEVVEIHEREIRAAGGANGIRDISGLESAIGAPQASFGGGRLMDIFGMAATYVNSLAFNHPFVDGNKRTALAAALTFLFLNGYEVEEDHDEELADKVLELLAKTLSKDGFAEHFKVRAKSIL